MRKIPVTMATQHPDNASAPYWGDDAFIDTKKEIEECFMMFDDLGCHEYMWDWEGKFADESVIEKLFRNHFDFFKKNKLGKDIFLTFRIPNIWREPEHRILKAFISILTSNSFSKDIGMNTPTIFEVILPMTDSHDQLMHIKKIFKETAEFEHKFFGKEIMTLKNIEVIPLIEGVDKLIDSDILLGKYIEEITEFDKKPEYLRTFIARSDPAINSGLIPAVISVKAALSKYNKLEKKTGVKIYPWLGAGSLPFRGGVNPENIEFIVNEYAGLASITVQSAFRYDYPKKDVKKSIKYLNEMLPKKRKDVLLFDNKEIENIRTICNICESNFKKTINNIADDINRFASFIPHRRERMLHVGLFGYSRGDEKVTLPRAIKFTGALYSVGVPPELISTGRSLRQLKEKGLLPFLEKIYFNLKRDLIHAGHYLNKENLNFLAKNNKAWKEVVEDIKIIEEYLGHELGAVDTHHYIHRNLTSTVFLSMKVKEDCEGEIIKAAKVRKSIG